MTQLTDIQTDLIGRISNAVAGVRMHLETGGAVRLAVARPAPLGPSKQHVVTVGSVGWITLIGAKGRRRNQQTVRNAVAHLRRCPTRTLSNAEKRALFFALYLRARKGSITSEQAIARAKGWMQEPESSEHAMLASALLELGLKDQP
jgi:hypothetical protein